MLTAEIEIERDTFKALKIIKEALNHRTFDETIKLLIKEYNKHNQEEKDYY